jgi:hypothetical protein
MKNVNINCTLHGVAGAGVQTTAKDIKRATKQAKREFGKDGCKKLHKILATNLTAMLPSIMQHGNAVDAYGEFYDTASFDIDLLWLAVFDSVGNKTKIKTAFGQL